MGWRGGKRGRFKVKCMIGNQKNEYILILLGVNLVVFFMHVK